MPEGSQVRCRPFKNWYALFLKDPKSNWFGNTFVGSWITKIGKFSKNHETCRHCNRKAVNNLIIVNEFFQICYEWVTRQESSGSRVGLQRRSNFVSKKNLMEIVKKLMARNNVRRGHCTVRDELLTRMIEINYQHVVDFKWYVTVLAELTEMETSSKHDKKENYMQPSAGTLK